MLELQNARLFLCVQVMYCTIICSSDNKLVAASVNRTLIAPCVQLTPASQRGFTLGRQFCLNIVVLDAFMRVFNVLSGFADDPSDISKCLVTVLYDICNAFTAIAHKWLFAVLICLELNPSLYRIIQLLYYNSTAYSIGIGTGDFLFRILAGV